MQQVSLEGDRFEELLRCLGILRDICNDADIREGVIRQKTNDEATVFEIDLSPILEDLSIPLINLKTKLDLLKIFSEQQVEITVHDNGSFSFSDQFSSLSFEGPELEYVDNKYINQEELSLIFTVNEDDLILSAEISKVISDRMRVISQGFNVNTVRVQFNGEDADLVMQTQSMEQSAKIMGEIISERPLQSSSSLVTTPFIIDHEGDILFKMFNYRDAICSNQCSTSISDININVYSRSQLTEEE